MIFMGYVSFREGISFFFLSLNFAVGETYWLESFFDAFFQVGGCDWSGFRRAIITSIYST